MGWLQSFGSLEAGVAVDGGTVFGLRVTPIREGSLLIGLKMLEGSLRLRGYVVALTLLLFGR